MQTDSQMAAEGTRLLNCSWRLQCGLKLPWRPFIDILGETDYTVTKGDDGAPRISYHVERWNISGLEALWQIVRPGRTASNT
eukprot:299440-Prorocentrum_minimum.AAC.5